jgi:hypothetical protein
VSYGETRAGRAEVSERFNGFMLEKDPSDYLGVPLEAFDYSVLFPLPPAVQADSIDVRSTVYHEVRSAIITTFGQRVENLAVDYVDTKVHREGPRHYLRVRLFTTRGTTVTTLFRCYTSGRWLYVAADSYLLPPISAWKLARAVILSVVGVFMALAFTFPFLILPWLILGWFYWRWWGDVLRGLFSGHLDEALRTSHPRTPLVSSFDADDTLMHLKSVSPVAVSALRSALARCGIDVRTFDERFADIERKMSTAGPTLINQGGVMNLGSVLGDIVNNARKSR